MYKATIGNTKAIIWHKLLRVGCQLPVNNHRQTYITVSGCGDENHASGEPPKFEGAK